MADTQPPHPGGRTPGPAPGALAGFEPGRVLGRGGHGVVVAARQRSLGREVALKRLPGATSAAGGTGDAARRLRAEAAALARLDHPHVVRILDVVPDGDGLALVLPLAAGGSLADLLDARGPRPGPEVAALGTRLAGALASAHRHGLLHLDVSPSNVLLTADGEPLLADFGVARAVGGDPGRSVTGTPGFVAPEAVLGHAGPASDVWSLGVLLGRALDPGRADPALAEVLARATEVDPGRRIGVEALADRLAPLAGRCPRPARGGPAGSGPAAPGWPGSPAGIAGRGQPVTRMAWAPPCWG